MHSHACDSSTGILDSLLAKLPRHKLSHSPPLPTSTHHHPVQCASRFPACHSLFLPAVGHALETSHSLSVPDVWSPLEHPVTPTAAGTTYQKANQIRVSMQLCFVLRSRNQHYAIQPPGERERNNETNSYCSNNRNRPRQLHATVSNAMSFIWSCILKRDTTTKLYKTTYQIRVRPSEQIASSIRLLRDDGDTSTLLLISAISFEIDTEGASTSGI